MKEKIDILDTLINTNEYIFNEYLDKYSELIVNSQTDEYCNSSYIHRTNIHHILPRSYFKYNNLEIDNSPENKCTLLFKDHILAHYYLYKCSVSRIQKYANAHAVIHLTNQQINFNELDDKFNIDSLDDYQQLYDDCKLGLHDVLSEKCSGDKNGNCKTDYETCQIIKQLLNEGVCYSDISSQLHCPILVVKSISTGKHWSCKIDNYISPKSKRIKDNRKYHNEHREEIMLEKQNKKQQVINKKLIKQNINQAEQRDEEEWYKTVHECKNCGKIMDYYYKSKKYGNGVFCSSNCVYSFVAKQRTPEQIDVAINHRRSYSGSGNPMYGKTFSEESRNKMSNSQKRVQSGARIMIKGNERRRVILSKQQEFLDMGYHFLKEKK